MQRVQLRNPGFSTADAEYPEFHAIAGALLLHFKDWQEQVVQVQFKWVCAFRWLEVEWLLPEGMKLRHLCLNFNACDKLEVLCVSYAVAV